MRRQLAWLVLGGLAALGCAGETVAPVIRNLDRPTAIAFACHGDLRLTMGRTESSPDDGIISSAQPVSACEISQTNEDPPGQEGLVTPNYAAFVLQTAKGTVAVVKFPAVGDGAATGAVVDADPLTPGKSSIPVGPLPVGIVADPAGCHMVIANGGSCDLSVLDVNSVIELTSSAKVERVSIKAADGTPLLAQPRSIVGVPGNSELGFECKDKPEGLVYVSYPDCHMVAAINPGTGAVVAGLSFAMDGTVTVTDGNVSCDAQCAPRPASSAQALGGLAGSDEAPRPVALHMAEDGGRLYIGAENSSSITIVELDAEHRPVSTSEVVLDGEIGITRLTASGVLSMGGDFGTFGIGSAGDMRFVYAIATDRTIRVAEVKELGVECDTQVDPRYLATESDVGFMSCMPVGDPRTPRRRAGAKSPGIHLPRDVLPLDVAFADVTAEIAPDAEPSPGGLVGHFAFATASDGFTYVINVDDDKYPDFERPDDLTKVFMPLALAHQVRDFVTGRNVVDGIGTDGATTSKCSLVTSDPLSGGPRISEPVSTVINVGQINGANVHMLPYLRQEVCTSNDEPPLRSTVSELSFSASTSTRELSYPDVKGIASEQWTLTWEGLISRDVSTVAVDGPPTRIGTVVVGADTRVVDSTGPYCRTGVEPYDMLDLIGCDPGRGDAECGLGQTCFVHPETTTVITRGMCLPSADVDRLTGLCRDVLTSRRRYTISETYKGVLVLRERRRVLRTSPVEGCTAVSECDAAFDVERALLVAEHPVDLVLEPPERTFTWACEPDPSRKTTANVCVMACTANDQCEDGWVCGSADRCVEAPLPPAECVAELQRYQIRVGEAFSVIGVSSGFLHTRIADESTGECVDDPDGNPLLIGRLPLQAPPCLADGPGDVLPNPCSVDVEHSENLVGYTFSGGECIADEAGITLMTRTAPAIRFQNPGLRFHLVDPTTRGDKNCFGDRAGDGPAYATVWPNYQLQFRTTGAFFPMFVTNVRTAFPISITRGPDGGLWVMDQGDVIGSGSSRGRVIRVDPKAGANGFAPLTFL